ncbi:hypothetical protein QPK87_04630 [Kamptonema cortianum]|nr:hypothetical protein [Kamptonema cortianum]
MALQNQSEVVAQLPPMETKTLLVFVKGKTDRTVFTPEKLQEMQQAHLDNLGRLYKEKKAPAAGPLGGDSELRGIVILDLPKEKVAEEFKEDPFVAGGLLDLQLHTWYQPKGMYAWPNTENFELGEYVFVWVTMSPGAPRLTADAAAKYQKQHVERNFALMRQGIVATCGPLMEGEEWRGIYIFNGGDINKVKAVMKDDPLVKIGHLDVEYRQLWMGKGLFKKFTWKPDK